MDESAVADPNAGNVAGVIAVPVAGIAAWRRQREERGMERPVCFVPTMGALHDGHAALIKAARIAGGQEAEVVVSVYVNPTQFNDAADFEAYPQTAEADVALAAAAGADTVVFPGTEELYPDGVPAQVERVHYGALTSLWEAEHRPGHFDGVVAVVRALFAQFRPQQVFFGEKDWQQLAVIKRLVAQEFAHLNVVPVGTVREPSGLALSSRNTRLSEQGRIQARALYAAMKGVVESGGAPDALVRAMESMESAGMRVEYLAVVDEADLVEPWSRKGPGRVLVAAWLDGVRLIDNIGILP